VTKDEAMKLVLRALETLNEELDQPIDIGPQTRLFGSEAVIDSLSLVSLIVDVETDASEAAGRSISLTDERALNRQKSPFADPDALAEYICELANEER
jgi:acyl carrier protein